MLSIFKLNLGIDFSSGTRVEILSNEPLTEVEVANNLRKLDIQQLISSFLVIPTISALPVTKMSSSRKKSIN